MDKSPVAGERAGAATSARSNHDGGTHFPQSVPLGHDFGRTPMGVEQVAARNALACCGDPGDCVGPCSSPTGRGICICDPDLLAVEIPDVRCPSHGLVAFLREALLSRSGT